MIKLYEDDLTEAGSPVIEFIDTNKIGGNTGCNSFGGEIVETKDKYIFKNIFSTKMFCEGRMDVESKFLSALNETENIKINDEQLIFYSVDKPVLIFTRENK